MLKLVSGGFSEPASKLKRVLIESCDSEALGSKGIIQLSFADSVQRVFYQKWLLLLTLPD